MLEVSGCGLAVHWRLSTLIANVGTRLSTLEVIDAKTPATGARMIARAWLDADFKARMLEDVNAAAEEMDIDSGVIPIRAIENTPGREN